MNDEVKLRESALLISKHFDINQREFEVENVDYELFIKNLTRIINYLLEKDFQRLMNGLYRIDVSEEKVNEVLNLSAPDEIGSNIAKLILERELQKVETRFKYR